MSVDREALHREIMDNLAKTDEDMRVAERNLRWSMFMLVLAAVATVVGTVARLWL
jgi:hypothetical protein